jgi:hypothetical protein
MTIQEASQRLGKSEATIRRAIKAEKLIASVVDGKYQITEESLSAYANTEHLSMQSDQVTKHDQTKGKELKVELERISSDNVLLRQELKQTYEWLKKKDDEIEDSRQRQDTIIMQLTRQLEQSQKMLSAHQEPWYRRWFRKNQQPQNR